MEQRKNVYPSFTLKKVIITVNNFLVEDIERVITTVPDNETSIELSSVIFCLGRDAENEEEYDYAFSKGLMILMVMLPEMWF